MTPDQIAEAFEKSRYEQLRGHLWADLRDAERDTRILVARKALDESGVTANINDLRRRAGQSDLLAETLEKRDGELTSARAAHRADVTRLEAEVERVRTELEADRERVRAELEADREQVRTELQDTIDELRAELAETRTLLSAAEHRADAAVEVIAAVRSALASDSRDVRHSPEPSQVTAAPPTAGTAPSEPPTTTPARGLFGRSRVARA